MKKLLVLVFALATPMIVAAQESISLEDAIRLAQQNNGFIRNAWIQASIGRSRYRQVLGNLSPTVTPTFRYDLSKSRLESGFGVSNTDTRRGTASLDARWTLLDSGIRSQSRIGALRSSEASKADAIQLLREELFTVHERYLNALRSQELVRVSESSVERANELLKSTEAQIALQTAPAKDRLQAQADALNAKVDLLTSKNRLSNDLALLRAILGLEVARPMPRLEPVSPSRDAVDLLGLPELIKIALAAREDLRARRLGIEAQLAAVRQAEIEAGITWTVDATASLSWSRYDSSFGGVAFVATLPLIDGDFRRQALVQQRLTLDSQRALLAQAERSAVAEIESAYSAYLLNRERLTAAEAALEAARENYKAAVESQRLGAEGTNVITVLTAKISLVTAESNHIEALYDSIIAGVRIKLATGQPIPGESLEVAP